MGAEGERKRSGRVAERERKGSGRGAEGERKVSEFLVFSNKVHVSCVHHTKQPF